MEIVDFKRGFINFQAQIWKMRFFFLTWRKKPTRKFFFGIIYVNDDELIGLCKEL